MTRGQCRFSKSGSWFSLKRRNEESMPFRDDLLTPIPGANPSGASLRYDGITDAIKEARREEIDAPQGEWKTAIKTADHVQVIKLAGEALAKRSKDLQIAVWLV